MRIGILQTGRSPDELQSRHGDYDDHFRRLLAGRGFEFATYPVLDNVLPGSVNEADGWLITGSRFGVYEGHPWIAPLEDFLRRAYTAGVPIVGICFGHQILAQALGGRVAKYPGGWQVGPVEYCPPGGDRAQTLLAWHQDQVIKAPEGATVLAGNEDCRNGILAYGDRALTMQPHPEFTPGFLADLIEARAALLPAGVAKRARTRLEASGGPAGWADRIERFLRERVATF